MQRTNCIYLMPRTEALATHITKSYGLEVPPDWEWPFSIEELPDTNDGLPASQRLKYYSEGGMAWPARTFIRQTCRAS